jgi:carboxymethylenebutenolidase
MKNVIALIVSIVIFQYSYAQTPTCCSASSTQEFAMLSSNKKFVASHDAPLPFTFESKNGKMVTIKTTGAVTKAYLVKAKKSTNNYIIMIHEWWGLNDYIKQEAARMQDELGNVNVIAIDLYDGKVATNADSASAYMQQVKEKRCQDIINGVIKYAGKNARIATVGWCFGGGWSMQATLLCKQQAAGCVIYYGMPELDPNKLKFLPCPVLGIFATQDEWINPKVVKQFESVMKNCDKQLIVKNYDAAHAFANPSNPKYNAKDANDAHTNTIQFFQKVFIK